MAVVPGLTPSFVKHTSSFLHLAHNPSSLYISFYAPLPKSLALLQQHGFDLVFRPVDVQLFSFILK